MWSRSAPHYPGINLHLQTGKRPQPFMPQPTVGEPLITCPALHTYLAIPS